MAKALLQCCVVSNAIPSNSQWPAGKRAGGSRAALMSPRRLRESNLVWVHAGHVTSSPPYFSTPSLIFCFWSPILGCAQGSLLVGLKDPLRSQGSTWKKEDHGRRRPWNITGTGRRGEHVEWGSHSKGALSMNLSLKGASGAFMEAQGCFYLLIRESI